MAFCNIKGMRWKLFNDMANDITFVHVTKVIQPVYSHVYFNARVLRGLKVKYPAFDNARNKTRNL